MSDESGGEKTVGGAALHAGELEPPRLFMTGRSAEEPQADETDSKAGTCSRLEAIRERSLRTADVEWLRQRYQQGALRCLGAGCREPALRLETPGALTPAERRALLQQIAPSLDPRADGTGSVRGGGDR